ncbi:apolipoprotein N-acyltransferase [Mycolicibacterium moriokaense]|uniref:apolipoprotein N-acyltransferase n=1 Tax=Mycolicibacterium moriokaense TaxID=39691 RepID=UPI000DA21435|nr:apolipoprotein N-acyltransferase [Mycolicibacterium moriokaense]MCV7038671.1 apolipoprotein N-acyltransferase [Mycolicibacterium moriokaense]
MIAGALLALAFPAPSWWWLAWIGLVPLLLVLRAAPTAAQGGGRAWCGMAGFVLATQYWLGPSAGPLLVVFAVAIGALWFPSGWAAHRLLSGDVAARQVLTAVAVLPSAWVIAEAVRSWHRLGGPWALLGASQWNQPATLAPASVGGVWLVSFLLVAVNTAVVGAILLRSWQAVALPVVLAVVGPVWFWAGPAPEAGATARVALVQPGDIAESTARQAASEALTEGLAGQRVDLVVWGESSVGVDLESHPEALRRLVDLRRRIGADLLVNVDARAPEGGIYKSSVLIGPDGVRGSYAKTRLVPFGEYVPLRPLLGWATRHTKAAGEDRRRGTGPVVLNTGPLTVGPLISFETTFSDLPRRAVRLGAELLAYQSSTSSYQGSWAQPQLASLVAVHAVEVGHPAVHAGLSGVSSAFDARGHRLGWLPATERGVLVVDVPLGSRSTLYDKFGDWPIVLAALVFTAWCARSARRS